MARKMTVFFCASLIGTQKSPALRADIPEGFSKFSCGTGPNPEDHLCSMSFARANLPSTCFCFVLIIHAVLEGGGLYIRARFQGPQRGTPHLAEEEGPFVLGGEFVWSKIPARPATTVAFPGSRTGLSPIPTLHTLDTKSPPPRHPPPEGSHTNRTRRLWTPRSLLPAIRAYW